jgi:FeS assembly SUF system regulator
MLRMSKLTDYGTLVLSQLALSGRTPASAVLVASHTRIAVPTVSKLLKALTRSGLVVSTRGAHGGYALARPAEEISAAEIIDALEGPVAITECSANGSTCDLESFCRVGRAWQRINLSIREALEHVTLADLQRRPQPMPTPDLVSHLRAAAN